MREVLFDATDFVDHPPTIPFDFPDETLAEQRILDTYGEARPEELEHGMAWYFQAHEMCINWAGTYRRAKSTEHVAGVVAALSPMSGWKDNIQAAQTLLETGDVKGLGYAVRDAKAILSGVHPRKQLHDPKRNNTKVRSFFENIADPTNPDFVTVDRHMIGMVLDNPHALRQRRWIRPYDHKRIGDHFKMAAKELDVVPSALQAVTWLVWRRKQGRIDVPDANQLTLFETV